MNARKRKAARGWVASLAAVTAAVVVAAAGATTNLLPNGGFESTCPGASCGWNAGVDITIGTDTSTFHGGSASLKVTSPAGNLQRGTYVCVALSPGVHEASYWYLAPTTDVLFVDMQLFYYSQPGCTGASSSHETLFGPTVGSWAQASGTFTAPAATQSAGVFLVYSCYAMMGACSVNFDDVDLEAEVVAATVRSFTATRTPAGVLVRWRTATEADTVGFHVYRAKRGRWLRVDRALIPAKGSPSRGARYSFLDRRPALGTVRYRLQAIGTDGSRTWYGGTSVIGDG